MEFFTQEDVRKILYDKFVVIIGDSVQRTAYKDLIRLLTNHYLLQPQHIRPKGEFSCCGDERVEWSGKTTGKWYREVRQYHKPHYLIRYYFVTRCYSDYMETILLDLAQEPQVDVVIMNSCLWDISRYGPSGIKDYKKNLQIVFSRFKDVLPKQALFIWLTAMPVGKKITAAFIIPDISFLENVLSIEVKEGNFYACQVAQEYKADILDLHWYFRHQIHLRENDGVHWENIAHRRITNYILEHLCKAWNILPPTKVFPKRVNVNRAVEVAHKPQKRGHQRSLSMPDRHFTSDDVSMFRQPPQPLLSKTFNNNNCDYFADNNIMMRDDLYQGMQSGVGQYNKQVVTSGVFGQYKWPQKQTNLQGPMKPTSHSYAQNVIGGHPF